MTDESIEIADDQTWAEAVEMFVDDAPWLTGADQPQVKALRAIAKALDGGAFQAALISQFTLIHRGLLQRRPGGKDGDGGGGGAAYDTPIDFGGWRADT